MRILQRDVNTAERGVNATVKTAIVSENNTVLNLPHDIRTRVNKAGAKIDWETYVSEETLQINPDILPNAVYCLMIGAQINESIIDNIVMQLNNYTKRYSLNPTTKIACQAVVTSAKPFARYLSLSAFKMSTLPIPKEIADERASSVISYYFEQRNISEEIKKVKLQQITNVMLEFMKKLISNQKVLYLNEEVKRNMENNITKLRNLKSVIPKQEALIEQRKEYAKIVFEKTVIIKKASNASLQSTHVKCCLPIPKLTGWPILTTSPDFEKILNQTRKNQKSTRKAYMIPGIKPECAIQSNKKANESSDKINQTLATPVIINRINGTPPQNPISEPVTPTKFRNETEISLANKTPSSKSQGRRLTEANQKLLLNQVEEYLNFIKSRCEEAIEKSSVFSSSNQGIDHLCGINPFSMESSCIQTEEARNTLENAEFQKNLELNISEVAALKYPIITDSEINELETAYDDFEGFYHF